MTDSDKFGVHRASLDDQHEWLRMRQILWPQGSEDEHRAEMKSIITAYDAVVMVCPRPGGGLQGFVEASIRRHAEGCDTSPVGYVEGWYVDEDVRGQGVGEALIRAIEEWSYARDCRELASDAVVNNAVGIAAHMRVGFEETEHLVHFRKVLDPRQ
jgi:aminoglycoside 6'-N-acetyltransferase I